jgi:CHAT domain-containing protein
MQTTKQKFAIGTELFYLILLLSGASMVFGQTPPPQNLEEKRLTAARQYDEGAALLQAGGEKSLRLALPKFQSAGKLFREIDYKNNEADSYFSIGFTYYNLNEKDTALEWYQKALPLYRTVNNKQWEAETLGNIGAIFENRREHAAAVENYRQAAAIYRIINNKKAEAAMLLRMGILYSELKEYRTALDADQQMLQIYRELKDKFGEATALNNIGVDFVTLGDDRQALDYYTKALALRREVGDKINEPDSLTNIANIYKNTKGKSQDALAFYKQAARLYKEIGNKESEAFVYSTIAGIYEDSENAAETSKYYGEALTIYRQLGDRYNEAATLLNIGDISFLSGDRDKTLEIYNQALQIYESLGKKNKTAEALSRIGNIYNSMLLPEKALGYLERALKIFRDLGEKEEEAATLVQLSGIYMQVGNKQKAREYAEQGRAFMQNALEEYSEVFGSLLMIGASIDGDDGEEAVSERLKEAFSKIDRRMTRHPFENTEKYLIRLGMSGFFYVLSKDNQKAEEYFNKALEVTRAEKLKPGEASVLYILGMFKAETDPQAALKNFKEGIALFRSTDELRSLEMAKSLEAILLMPIAMAYMEMYEKEKNPEYLAQAVSYLNQSLTLSRASKDKSMEALFLMLLMEFWKEAEHPQLAIRYGKQAVNIFQSLRGELKDLDKSLQDSYIHRVSNIYQDLAELLIAQGRIAEAEQVLAMLKEEEFFEYLRRDDKVARELLATLSLTPAEQEAFKRYDKLADKMTKVGEELGELQRELSEFLTKNPTAGIEKFPKKSRLEKLEKQLADANKVFNAFIDQLKIKFGQTDERVTKVDSGTQALLKELNQPRTVIISTIAGNDRLNLIVTTPEIPRAHIVNIKAADLNQLVFEFRNAVKNPSIDPRPIGKKLYDVLFPADLQKDLDNIKADTIIWSLDGTLRYVPIAALWDGRQYLAERYANAVITLASRDKINSQTTDRKNWTALGVGVSKSFENFPPLAAVPEELCSVVNDVQSKAYCAALLKDKTGVITGRILPDEKFTLSDFKANLGRFPIVHIASHFSLNAGNESSSYLLLGGGAERKWSLSAVRESGARFVGVDLLTLSACNTAMTAGEKSNGLEVEGFGALAQKQGARSVLASLWAVADSSTRDLMTEFYRILEADTKISKAAALRQAQLTLLNGKYKPGEIPLWRRSSDVVELSGENRLFFEFKKDANAPFAHPYYWSAFVLYGNLR